ncbi:cyclase-associated protein [Lentinus tigrinus ALCF2SS1-7]|uniref:Adenylyl cyclase-associated protein n=1 Tax=Lentinus tigrinus ALCF2SS1-6 TaxID=1328759 RepID=A0A5C2S759_9APHY|nr:cyclase-associated protein [Lentinus tigrinus ALCF2SS1-6]RPD73478.1 cyclase-associated protein [Lentinus tigrinus ALCF2SS1-7]
MASGGLHSLATIIKRLEATTSRLEDLAALGTTYLPLSAQGAASAITSPASANAEQPTPVPPPPPPPAAAAAVPAEDPRSVVAFDEQVIEGKLKPFVELTKGFASPSVIEQVGLVEQEFKDLRELLLVAGSCKKPDQSEFEKLLGPLQKDIEAITRAKEANRKDREWFNHLSTVAEGAPCVGWVTVEPKPGPYVSEIKESTQFYGNRVIKEFKERDPKHGEWVKGYITLLEELRKYIMEYHTTGLVWNPNGVSVSQFKSSSSAAPTAGGAPPPPPPPPPPVAPPPPPAGAAAPAAGGISAVFEQLNRGEEVTKGLRKVDKSEMTHKNPALRAGGTVPATVSSPAAPAGKRPIKPSKPQALMGKKPAKFALEGNKWMIEYQENQSALTVDNVEISQTVNLFGCKNTTVIIKGKANAITLVNCVKTSVLVDSVISSVSVTNSPSFALQITGKAPTIQLDSTDSGQIYLSKECLGVEITTAKCSAINISLPVEGEEDGVFNEHPVPEMFRTTIVDGKLVTTAVEHAG